MELIRARAAETIVVDHHLLRDLAYRERLAPHTQAAEEEGVRLLTAAEFMGVEVTSSRRGERSSGARKGAVKAKGEARRRATTRSSATC